MTVHIKRVYDPPFEGDGLRILVDRLWPRGLKKENIRIDLWLKEIAPSTELRKWFDHDPEKWVIFKERYQGELENNSEAVDILIDEMKKGRVTLLFSAKNIQFNNAAVLKEYLEIIDARCK